MCCVEKGTWYIEHAHMIMIYRVKVQAFNTVKLRVSPVVQDRTTYTISVYDEYDDDDNYKYDDYDEYGTSYDYAYDNLFNMNE